jgi:hypothetical protein
MPGPHGKYTLDEMKGFIALYIEHLSEGLKKESFDACDYRTIDTHILDNPDSLQTEKEQIEIAYRKGLKVWDKLGKKITETGEGSATCYAFNMKNRYPQYWADKREMKVEGQVSNITIIPDDGCEPISD